MEYVKQYCQFFHTSFAKDLLSGCIFRQIVDMARVGFLVAEPDGTIKYMNKVYADMFQIDIQEGIGSNICRYFPKSRLITIMRTGEVDQGIIFSHKGRDALISRYPIMAEGRILGGYIEVYFRDITELSDLAHRVRVLERKVRLYERASPLPKAHYTFSDIVSDNEAVARLKARANKYSQTNFPVLIMGETGTGKELLAHSIHAASPRAQGPFISVNCAAIPENLLESELFGYADGTFTGARQGGMPGKFELADKGTIFLDEIGELPQPLQAKLLRVIETREIQKLGKSLPVESDFRLVAATNLDLGKSVEKGVFRGDLFYRLSSLCLHIPPLRERREDIPLLVEHQLAMAEHAGTPGPVRVHPEVMALLMRYTWPGNVRELRNMLGSAVVSLEAGEDEIFLRHLPPHTLGAWAGLPLEEPAPVREPPVRPLKQARQASEYEMILAAVREAGGNKSRAAGLLGISRNELYRKLRRAGLTAHAVS